jgi:hypothetical protein
VATAAPVSTPQPDQKGGGIAEILLANRAFLLVATAYVGIAWALGHSSLLAIAGDIGFASGFAVLLLAISILFVVTRCRWRLARNGWTVGRRADRRAWRATLHVLRRNALDPGRAGSFLLTMATYSLFMRHFARVKGSIAHRTDFGWDPLFMQLDRQLHFGRHPWEIIQPLLGTPVVTILIDFAYYAWFAIVIGTIAWLAWQAHSKHRVQFFLSLVLTWSLLGSLAAYAFASAGPIYYAEVTADPVPYGSLLSYLTAVDAQWGLRAFVVRDLLWAGYIGISRDMFEGIAAMPSLHVAISVLLALAMMRGDRRVAFAYAVYAVVILIGSVHLAWHYAIDGYASIAAVPVIWWASGRLARYVVRSESNPPSDGLHSRRSHRMLPA